MEDSRQDILRICRECGERFWIAVGEQMFYEWLHYELPGRCASCRRARKQARVYMASASDQS